MSKFVAGIDFGTQSLKIGIYDLKGKRLAIESHSFKTNFLGKRLVEQDPNEWWDGLVNCFSKLSKKIDLDNLEAISVCATSSTVLLTDKDLVPLQNALSWMDSRSISEEEFINSHESPLVQHVLKYSGGKVSAEWMIVKALWLKNNYELTGKYIVEQLDWINYKLTGLLVASQCNATCKWTYVQSEGGFSQSFFEEIGLDHIEKVWPKQVLKVGDLIGEVDPKTAVELGIKKGVLVFQGGVDAHIGMLGSASVDYGSLCLITGTSFVHLVHHPEPIFKDGLWGPYDSPIIDENWLIEGGQKSAGSLISWFLNEFYSEEERDEDIFRTINEEIKGIPIVSDGLLILDHWEGNRTHY